MTVQKLLAANRSYRRFRQDRPLAWETLVDLVALTTLCPSAANRQPLKYRLSWEPETNASIFARLHWAAALKDWPGPAEGERPTGYIIVLGDKRIATNFHCDHGIAAQSILLSAVERGLRGCILAAIDRPELRRSLDIPEHLDILLVLALGYPNETIVLEHGKSPDPVPYWRDANDVHHVPKRSVEEILLNPSQGQ